MTIDEAIKNEEEIAIQQIEKANALDNIPLFGMSKDDIEEIKECYKCSKEHEQLAEWLKELKTYREAQVTDAVDRVTIKEYLDSFDNDTSVTATDCIRRSDMLDAVGHGTTYTSEEVQDIIDGMPSVTPQYCGDCISREETLRALMDEWTEYDRELIGWLYDKIDKLPSVTPQPKVGRWTRELIRNEYGGCIGAKMICSECGQDNGYDKRMKFCPSCGSYNGGGDNGNE